MPRITLLVSSIVLAFGACSIVAGPSFDLNGTWGWEYNLNPAGSSMAFSLAASGGKVTGSGISYGIGPAHTPDSLAVAGQESGIIPYVQFHLIVTFSSGAVVTYDGRLVGANELEGTWTSGDQSNTVRFYRQ